MAIFKCKMCGGALEVSGDSSVATCEYCGSVQTLPKKNDDVIANLFNRANNLRIKCEFDKASEVYEKILNEDNNEAEAHWGLVLCKYGIEYVEDPKTYKRIPTCHRTQYESILTDVDYLSTLANSDGERKDIYKSQAEEIANLQKDILAIVENEKPFDVFICYKETDENGQRTVDSTLANDIYYQLTQEGLKVFYAAITLEDKLGVEYEPYIFAALNSAKVMLVVGTKSEYFDAVWVKNEWSRYLKLMKADRSKLLIPCYRDMDAYDLPEEFSHLQAQDMGKIGFVNDIVRGIKKIAKPDEPKTTETVKAVPVADVTVNSNIAALLDRAFMALEDGEFSRADEFCEQVLNADSRNALAYLGKLMAELRVKKREKLEKCDSPFHNSNNYQKAIRFGDSALKTELEGSITTINERNENNRLVNLYNKAVEEMNAAHNESYFKVAANSFKAIAGFKDADILAQKCLEKAETARMNQIYSNAMQLMSGNMLSECQTAHSYFEQISGWKDADEQAQRCKNKIEKMKAQIEADRLEQERQEELARIKSDKKKKLIKMTAFIVTPITAVTIVFVIVLNMFILPKMKLNDAMALIESKNYEAAYVLLDELGESDVIKDSKYNRAVELMNTQDYDFAIKLFNQITDYKDVESKIETCNVAIFGKEKWDNIKNLKFGSEYTFGKYEQDNNTTNGKEAIKWIVLERQENKILVISKYALDCQKFNKSFGDVTWETCTLRKWLNDDFINLAFSDTEKASISTVTVTADAYTYYDAHPGNDTQDKVFLLSINEAKTYFLAKYEGVCQPTDYSVSSGVYSNSDGNCSYWLRSPGSDLYFASFIDSYGDYKYGDVSSKHAVRPAMWITL